MDVERLAAEKIYYEQHADECHMDNHGCAQIHSWDGAEGKLDLGHQIRVAMERVGAFSDHVGHEKPGDDASTQPQEIRSVAVERSSQAQTDFQREPETEYVHGRVHEQPRPRKGGAAALLLEFENGQLPNLAAPLPIVFQYGAKRAQLITLSCADTNMAIVPQLLCHGRNPKETAQLRSCLNTSAESSCPYRLEDSQRTCR